MVKKWKRVKWTQFTDEEIHELTAAQIAELTDGATVDRFKHRLRMFASNNGFKSSAANTDTGLRFRLWQESELDAYLPREVTEQENRVPGLVTTRHAECTHPNTSWDRTKCRERRGVAGNLQVQTSHADCGHPATAWARRKCRESRAGE